MHSYREELEELRQEIEELIGEPKEILDEKEQQIFARMVTHLQKLLVTYDGEVAKLWAEAGQPEKAKNAIANETAARETTEYLIRFLQSFLPTTH